MMRLDLATDDYIGARAQQQDAASARSIGSDGGAILVLADGLGGHTGGAEASRIVVETFRDAADTGIFDEELSRRIGLRTALESANERIANGVDPTHGQRSMASTAVAAVIADGMVNWISVGDSHLYVWRRGRLAKLNEDHSQAGLMVRSGQYKEGDPEVLAAKSVLVSALTGRKLEIVDHPTQAFVVQKDDIIVLASDGLNTLSEDEIEETVSEAQEFGARQISVALLDRVRERRAERQDNTAVVIARVVDAPDRVNNIATQVAADTQRVTAPTEIRAELTSTTARLDASSIAASAGAGRVEAERAAPREPDPAPSKELDWTPSPAARPANAVARPSHLPAGLIANVILGLAALTLVAGAYYVWRPSDPTGGAARAPSGPATSLPSAPSPGSSGPAAVPTVVPAVPPVTPAVPAPATPVPATPDAPKSGPLPTKPPPGVEPTRTPGFEPAVPQNLPLPAPTVLPGSAGTPPVGPGNTSGPSQPQLIEPPTPVPPTGNRFAPPATQRSVPFPGQR